MGIDRLNTDIRSFIHAPSRRDILRGLAGAGYGSGIARWSSTADARKNRKRKKRTQKAEPNAFGCVDVGSFCKKDGQCCSGVCQGKKDKRRCKAHNVLDCPAGADQCAQAAMACGPTGDGHCYQTTGQASFCTDYVVCNLCERDTDCQALDFGPGAACVVCANCPSPGNTACAMAAPAG
jgi:hypothetical protein